MSNKVHLIKEQKICISCGFCCDATLFTSAVLEPGEKGNLPDKIEQNYFKENDKEYFKQPCLYFKEKCTIYELKKAHICSAFRCQLLNNFEKEKISMQEALELVQRTKQTRSLLLSEFQLLSGNRESFSFREMLLELGKKQRELASNSFVSMEWEIFTAKCNIFESLLIKHFKSEDNFQSMVTKEEKEN